MGCCGALTACILQWPTRRCFVFAGMFSYLFWIAVVHHHASTWMRGDLMAVAEMIAPFEKISVSKAKWISLLLDDPEDQSGSVDIVASKLEGSDSGHEESQSAALPAFSAENKSDRVVHESNSSHLRMGTTVEPRAPFSTVLTDSESSECGPMQIDEIAYTLVTQCDDDRIEMVVQHCLRWNGPLSIAVYSPRAAEEILADIVALGCRKEQLHVSTLDPSETLSKDSYPVNHLRNMALRSVETSHIVYMDIDFLPSSDLESTLQAETIREALAEDHKHALVIPAFEYKPANQASHTHGELLNNMPSSRNELMQLHDQGEASMFHEYWPVAHDSTDYAMWKHQEHGSLLPISCIRSNHYEPYLIIRKCQEMPPFQEAFTGYGYNKASFTMQLQAMQYRLSQVGGIFCTHFPHEVSIARQLFDQDKATKTGRRLEIAELVKDYSQWLDKTYGHNPPKVPNCKWSGSGRKNVAAAKQDDAISGSEEPMDRKVTQFFGDSPKLGVCNDLEPEEVTYSLVTQCSDDRLWMMEHHCQRWAVNNTHPHISLVVYTNETLEEVKEKLVDLNCPVDNGLTVQIFPRIYEDKDYPVNHFRNEALAAVNTTHAVFIDVDFWVSTNLHSSLNEETIRTTLAESVQNAIIVPAFQLLSQCKDKYFDCPDKHIPMMPLVKDEAMESRMESGNITVFNLIHNFRGHGSTRYDLWATQPANELLEIDCVKSNRYEPYLIVRVCRDLPQFQPVFTGYGKNKISWILHLRRLGYRFFQMGQAFVIHYPHRDSKAKRAWKGGTVRGVTKDDNTTIVEDSMRTQNDQYFVEFRQWLATSVPNRTKIMKCTDNGFSPDDDAALWVARDESTPVAF